jgi:hypothetical protein
MDAIHPPAFTLAPACDCWSCGHQCGGSTHPQSCGPAEDVDGRLICQGCREKAQVFGSEDDGRAGTVVQVTGENVRLTVDVFETFKSRTTYLTAASARHLAELLVSAADDLDALASVGWAK